MTPDDRLDWLTERVHEFMRHLREAHGDDPRTRTLHQKVRGVSILNNASPRGSGAGTVRNGMFKHSTGVVSVGLTDAGGRPRTEASLLKTVVHELAHATRVKEPGETSHSVQWKQTWLWFLSVATQELKWDVEIKCSECTFYGLCERDMCPKCTWLQDLCKPYAGAPSG